MSYGWSVEQRFRKNWREEQEEMQREREREREGGGVVKKRTGGQAERAMKVESSERGNKRVTCL